MSRASPHFKNIGNRQFLSDAKIDMSGPDKLERRSNYKAVWLALSEDEASAKIHVTGTEDEAALTGSGIGTTKFLLENVGAGRSDVVLEIGCGIGRVGRELAP